jgi:hypothetical protein
MSLKPHTLPSWQSFAWRLTATAVRSAVGLYLTACSGLEGPPGGDGADGLTTLSAVLEADEDECPTGGDRIDFGLDGDRDGVLAADEVLGSALLCAQGPGGVASMQPGWGDSPPDAGDPQAGDPDELPRAEASGAEATALGGGTVASGDYSVAMGYRATATGEGAIAAGYGSEARESFSIAMGYYASATGPRSTATGYFTSASGYGSTAFGASTEAAGYVATTMGLETMARGSVSTAMGGYSEANGDYSTALGYHAVADSQASFAVGSYNVGGGSAETWVPTDPLFEVGNGISDAETHNALTILKNGHVGVNTSAPEHVLDVDGHVRVASSLQDGSAQLTVANDHPTNAVVGVRLTSSGGALVLRSSDGGFGVDIEDGDAQELNVDRDGNLVIQGAIVASGSSFPDYVFEDDYALMSLSDLGAYIVTHGHLPGVPTAEEASRDGVNMTEMQKLLLEKVEELTLHAIAQHDAHHELRREAAMHDAQVFELRSEVAACQAEIATRDARVDEQAALVSALEHRLSRLEQLASAPLCRGLPLCAGKTAMP